MVGQRLRLPRLADVELGGLHPCGRGADGGEEGFAVALDRLGIERPDMAVFLDDVESNVVGAREAGLHGIIVVDIGDALSELDRLLIEERT